PRPFERARQASNSVRTSASGSAVKSELMVWPPSDEDDGHDTRAERGAHANLPTHIRTYASVVAVSSQLTKAQRLSVFADLCALAPLRETPLLLLVITLVSMLEHKHASIARANWHRVGSLIV